MKTLQVWIVVLLAALTEVVVHHRGDTDRVPTSQPLNTMPMSIGQWKGEDEPISQASLDILGKGIFLNRLYAPAMSTVARQTSLPNAPVSLFIGYFPTQRTGSSIHSPQHCLPGSGWSFDASGVTGITGADGKTEQVGDYLISNGTEKLEVLYWYQTHGRAVANDYAAKIYMMADSIRYNRSDAALVRVITPIQESEDRGVARSRAITFAERITPLLPAYVPN